MTSLSPKTLKTLEKEFNNINPDEGQIVRLQDSIDTTKYNEYIYTNNEWFFHTFNFFDDTCSKTDNKIIETVKTEVAVAATIEPIGAVSVGLELQDVVDVLISTPCNVHLAIKLLTQIISIPKEKAISKKRIKKSVVVDMNGVPIPRKRSSFNVFMSDTLASLDRTIPYKERMATAIQMYKQFKENGNI